MQKIPLGIAYATWSAVGLVLTASIAVMIFKETLNVYSIYRFNFDYHWCCHG